MKQRRILNRLLASILALTLIITNTGITSFASSANLPGGSGGGGAAVSSKWIHSWVAVPVITINNIDSYSGLSTGNGDISGNVDTGYKITLDSSFDGMSYSDNTTAPIIIVPDNYIQYDNGEQKIGKFTESDVYSTVVSSGGEIDGTSVITQGIDNYNTLISTIKNADLSYENSDGTKVSIGDIDSSLYRTFGDIYVHSNTKDFSNYTDHFNYMVQTPISTALIKKATDNVSGEINACSAFNGGVTTDIESNSAKIQLLAQEIEYMFKAFPDSGIDPNKDILITVQFLIVARGSGGGVNCYSTYDPHGDTNMNSCARNALDFMFYINRNNTAYLDEGRTKTVQEIYDIEKNYGKAFSNTVVDLKSGDSTIKVRHVDNRTTNTTLTYDMSNTIFLSPDATTTAKSSGMYLVTTNYSSIIPEERSISGVTSIKVDGVTKGNITPITQDLTSLADGELTVYDNKDKENVYKTAYTTPQSFVDTVKNDKLHSVVVYSKNFDAKSHIDNVDNWVNSFTFKANYGYSAVKGGTDVFNSSNTASTSLNLGQTISFKGITAKVNGTKETGHTLGSDGYMDGVYIGDIKYEPVNSILMKASTTGMYYEHYASSGGQVSKSTEYDDALIKSSENQNVAHTLLVYYNGEAVTSHLVEVDIDAEQYSNKYYARLASVDIKDGNSKTYDTDNEALYTLPEDTFAVAAVPLSALGLKVDATTEQVEEKIKSLYSSYTGVGSVQMGDTFIADTVNIVANKSTEKIAVTQGISGGETFAVGTSTAKLEGYVIVAYRTDKGITVQVDPNQNELDLSGKLVVKSYQLNKITPDIMNIVTGMEHAVDTCTNNYSVVDGDTLSITYTYDIDKSKPYFAEVMPYSNGENPYNIDNNGDIAEQNYGRAGITAGLTISGSDLYTLLNISDVTSTSCINCNDKVCYNLHTTRQAGYTQSLTSVNTQSAVADKSNLFYNSGFTSNNIQVGGNFVTVSAFDKTIANDFAVKFNSYNKQYVDTLHMTDGAGVTTPTKVGVMTYAVETERLKFGDVKTLSSITYGTAPSTTYALELAGRVGNKPIDATTTETKDKNVLLATKFDNSVAWKGSLSGYGNLDGDSRNLASWNLHCLQSVTGSDGVYSVGNYHGTNVEYLDEQHLQNNNGKFTYQVQFDGISGLTSYSEYERIYESYTSANDIVNVPLVDGHTDYIDVNYSYVKFIYDNYKYGKKILNDKNTRKTKVEVEGNTEKYYIYLPETYTLNLNEARVNIDNSNEIKTFDIYYTDEKGNEVKYESADGGYVAFAKKTNVNNRAITIYRKLYEYLTRNAGTEFYTDTETGEKRVKVYADKSSDIYACLQYIYCIQLTDENPYYKRITDADEISEDNYNIFRRKFSTTYWNINDVLTVKIPDEINTKYSDAIKTHNSLDSYTYQDVKVRPTEVAINPINIYSIRTDAGTSYLLVDGGIDYNLVNTKIRGINEEQLFSVRNLVVTTETEQGRAGLKHINGDAENCILYNTNALTDRVSAPYHLVVEYLVDNELIALEKDTTNEEYVSVDVVHNRTRDIENHIYTIRDDVASINRVIHFSGTGLSYQHLTLKFEERCLKYSPSTQVAGKNISDDDVIELDNTYGVTDTLVFRDKVVGDTTWGSDNHNKGNEIKFAYYPEIRMVYYKPSDLALKTGSITSAKDVSRNLIKVMGEQQRTSYSSGLYIYSVNSGLKDANDSSDVQKNSNSSGDKLVSGATISSGYEVTTKPQSGNDPVIYAGSDVTLEIESDYTINLYGYALDLTDRGYENGYDEVPVTDENGAYVYEADGTTIKTVNVQRGYTGATDSVIGYGETEDGQVTGLSTSYSFEPIKTTLTRYNQNIVDNSDIYSVWGNKTNYATYDDNNRQVYTGHNYDELLKEYSQWATSMLNPDIYSLDISLNVQGNGYDKTYTDFNATFGKFAVVQNGKIQNRGYSEALDNTSDGVYKLNIENGKVVKYNKNNKDELVWDAYYLALIQQIALDANISLAEADKLFDDSDLATSIYSAIQSSNDTVVNGVDTNGDGDNKNNQSGKDDTTDKYKMCGNEENWYDEKVKTVVVRRFKTNSVTVSGAVLQDKLDYSMTGADSSKTYDGTWYYTLTIKDLMNSGLATGAGNHGSYSIINKKAIDGANFDIIGTTDNRGN